MKKIKLLSILLSVVLIFLLISPQFVLAAQQDSKGQDLEKIHLYLGNKKNSVRTEKELSSELKKAREEESNESIFIMVEFQSGYFETPEYLEISKSLRACEKAEECQSLLHKAHVFSKQYHEEENAKNFELLKVFNVIDYSFISYSPFIRLEFNRKNIDLKPLIQLVHNDKTVNISIYLETPAIDTAVATWTQTLKAIHAYSTVSTGYYTGQWSKIGIFEAGGICDTTNTNLSGKDITIDPNCSTTSNHATTVTSVAALIAPDAKYYVSSDFSNGGLAWFIDNDCTVVNCSFSFTDTSLNPDNTYSFLNTGYRYYLDGLYDYQIRANFISCVVSSSNVRSDNTYSGYNPNGYVLSPGLAHNAITVGGVERKTSLLSSYLEYESSACYQATNQIKPEISAVNYLTVPNLGSYKGTSYSAPQVTGCIALFLEMFGSHYSPPEELRAIVVASAAKTTGYSETYGYFDEKVGAGCIDFINMREFDYLAHGFYIQSLNNNPNSIVYSKNISLSKDQTIQTALSWLADVSTSPDQTKITNYDLRLYNPNGVLVASSALGSFSNIEFIRYKAPSAGTYTVSIYQNDNMQTNVDSYGIAICLD